MGALGGGGGGMGGPMDMMSGAMGSMGLDMGLHKMPIIGGFFQNPNELHKREQFSRAGRAYGAYRPEMAQAWQNAMGNRSSAFQGANNVLASMYGGGGSAPPAQMGRTPMGPSMMLQGASMPGRAPVTAGGFLGGMGLGGLLGGSGMPGGGFLGGMF